MKKLEAIKADYRKINEAIKADEATIDALLLKDEKKAAINDNNTALYKEHAEKARQNEARVLELSETVYINKIVLKILNDNMKAAAVAEVIPVLKDVIKKYDGKPCGPKTYEKIRDAVKEATGLYVGISGQDITIYNAAIQYNNDARIHTGYNTPVITSDNIIDASALDEYTTPHKYEKNPAAAAKKLIKLYNKARAAYETAEAAMREYNHAAPEGLYKNVYIKGILYHTML